MGKVSSMPTCRHWCHCRIYAWISIATAWKSGVYHLLPMCHL